MDTAAYLTRQGWRGSGHSLHPSGHGIAKPLLISKKNDVLGVGNRKNDALAGQWWLKAFDNSLKQVNIGTADGAPKPVEKVTPTFQRSLYNNALYSNFVKGEGLSGTQTPAIKPLTKMESIRQLDGSRNDGTSLESEEKGRDDNGNADHAGERSPLVLTIAGSGSVALENEVTKYSQRKLKKNRKAEHFLAPEFNGEKGAAYLETRPLVDGVEETPWLKRKLEDEPWETRKPESSEYKNPATSENGVLDGDPPRKRRRGRKGLREAGYIETPVSVSGEEKGLADAKMESSDYEVLKDSWSNPMVEEKSGKTEGQERRTVEISDDEMDILSKLEEQLSIETTAGQEKQARSANGQDQSKQLGMHQQQLTNQEIKETKKMRKKQRKLQRAKWSLEKDPKRVSQPNTDTLSQLADDLSKDHGSATREWNRTRRDRRRNRILGDDAGQSTSSLPSMPRKQRRKKRIVGNNSAQPNSTSPPMPRKNRRKNRILDNARQPTSSLPPTANHMSGGDRSALLKKNTKRLSVRLSGRRVDGPVKTSRPLSGAANDVPGQGKPASWKPRRIVGRNEKIFEYDDEPVVTPMDAITRFLKNRAAK